MQNQISTVSKLSRALNKIVHYRLKSPGVAEPPRLVRANSAFDMMFSFMKKD